MIDTFVGGIGPDCEWMLNLVTYDYVRGMRRDYMWFFNTRDEAEKYLDQVLAKMTHRNVIVKIIKIGTIEKEI